MRWFSRSPLRISGPASSPTNSPCSANSNSPKTPEATIFFWPSRLDPVQKGPQLFTTILHQLVADYWLRNLQVVVVANGPHEQHFHHIVQEFGLHDRVAVVDFDERLSRLAYAGSDFMVMPSLFEPCGLPQMTAPLYGTLPVVHATGGLYDTIRPLDVDESTGNGFRFNHYSADSLRWAIDRAMDFQALPQDIRDREISRIMRESLTEFSHQKVAKQYIAIYEEMLARPLVEKEAGQEFAKFVEPDVPNVLSGKKLHQGRRNQKRPG